MNDREQILHLWSETESRGESAVLATVVKTSGSSYRLPGARLLVTQTGRAGSISGGCLEDDLVKKAWWLTEAGPAVRRYDTTPDGELATDFGLGCNGIIHVLLERISPGSDSDLRLIESVRRERRQASLVHVIGPRTLAGRKLSLDTDGNFRRNFENAGLEAQLRRSIDGSQAEQRTSSAVITEDGLELFVETLVPPIRLLIFGAGDDAVPLSTLGKFLGWEVIVIDGRSHYARREKFPHADEVLVRPAGHAGLRRDQMDAWTVAVVMTHSYSQDLEIVHELASQPLRYLGILGPRKRSRQLLADAALEPSAMGREIFTPVGLDIGADGPDQVALAVMAEIQAVLNARRGGFLRERAGSIHSGDGHSLLNEEPFVVPTGACAL